MTATEAAARIERLFAEIRTDGFSISGDWLNLLVLHRVDVPANDFSPEHFAEIVVNDDEMVAGGR